jgi:aspartate ammonia-lyase
MFVCCDCCVLSGKGLCDGLITSPEESYRLWCVVVCDKETSKTRRLNPLLGYENTTTMGCNARKTNKQIRRLEKITCTDRVKNEKVLHRVKEQREILHTKKKES